MFKRTFWLSLVLTIPTLVFSHGLQDILGLGGPRFSVSQHPSSVRRHQRLGWTDCTLITSIISDYDCNDAPANRRCD
jgi:hypothetical protein